MKERLLIPVIQTGRPYALTRQTMNLFDSNKIHEGASPHLVVYHDRFAVATGQTIILFDSNKIHEGASPHLASEFLFGE